MYAMRTLYLLRHAKASLDDPERADIDRPLTDRGRRDAANLGEHLRISGCRPALILCSPSLRTRQTLDLVASGLGLQAKVQVDDSIYAATAKTLWQRVRELPDPVNEALIIGHNPSLYELAVSLSEHGDDKLRARLRRSFRPVRSSRWLGTKTRGPLCTVRPRRCTSTWPRATCSPLPYRRAQSFAFASLDGHQMTLPRS
jgi:phosphohistidine phosphatase